MSLVVDTIVIGLQNGAIFALVALGLALVYKATRVLNFAHGEIGTMSAYAALLILIGFDLEAGQVMRERLWLATLVALAVGATFGVLTNFVLRWMRTGTAVTALVATVGIALLFVAIQITWFQPRGRSFPRYIEGNICLSHDAAGECARQLTMPFGTVPISWHTVVILGVLAAAAALLALFFQTPPGVALLATAQDPFAAELQGVSVRAMTTIAWGGAGALAALAGLLGAGIFNSVSPALVLTTFLIPGFTAALLGGITSMVGAVVGGLLLGLIVAGANQTVQSLQIALPGPPQIAVLVILLAVLVLRPRGLLGTEA